MYLAVRVVEPIPNFDQEPDTRSGKVLALLTLLQYLCEAASLERPEDSKKHLGQKQARQAKGGKKQ